MAARWGAGEETLTACNMDFFPMETLDEAAGLNSGETLEALQSCLDPSIRSIFEDIPTVEAKGLDEESEAMLLTALTEMLDGVDDENLSPFDTLPDSDLLSHQKGGELSPLKRMLSLSRSPQEKNSLCSARSLSTGKSRPRMQAGSLQRSDGEEEEDGSLTLSPERHVSSPHNELLDWESLTLPLPVTFEPEGEDGLSVSLGDLVRHMHPYCMSISVENEEGEQILPEGGILLEVVDQGENGEPILAIPDMDLPISVPLKEVSSGNLQKVSDEAEETATDSSEHIIVDDDDDDDDVNKASLKVAAPMTPELCLNVKDEMVTKGQKDEIKAKSPARRKKKLKDQHQPKSTEGRVLRSGTVRRKKQESQGKPEERSVKEEKNRKVPKVPLPSAPTSSLLKPKELKPQHTTTRIENISATQLPEMNEKIATPLVPAQNAVLAGAAPGQSQLLCSVAVSSQKPCEIPKQPVKAAFATPSVPHSSVSSESPAAAPSPATPDIAPPVSVPPAVPDPKPKSLSLEEYRRLRQQKKPVPVKKQDDNSTKWPSLPELPKELPPIPCLPAPNPKDPRRPIPQAAKKEVEEVKPAWQPRGAGAPPTPEALLVPPAYMISSSKAGPAASVPKAQQTPEPSNLPSKPSAPAPKSMKDLATHPHTTTQPTVPSVPPASLKSDIQPVSSADGKCFPVLSRGEDGSDKLPQSHPASAKSVCPPVSCPETTTDVMKPTVATTPVAPQKNTDVPQKMSDTSMSTQLNNPVTCTSKSPKPTASVPQPPPPAALSDSPSPTPPVAQQLETKEKATIAEKPQRFKSPTQELIECFTSEMGIEASDLTSLLEQFEETQAKEEQCVPEVSGRAAAVGNSSVPEKSVLERVKADDLSSTAALTPPATPPHQMWKPLAPVALLGKSKSAEASKSSPSKVIQIEAQPLPSVRSRSKPTPAAATVAPDVACMDHDYCLPNKGTAAGESSKRWNVKQRSFITIKPIKEQAPTTTQAPVAVSNPVVSTKKGGFPEAEHTEQKAKAGAEGSSVLETPDASPSHLESESTFKDRSPRRGTFGRSYRRRASCHSPSPTCSPKERTGGRSGKRRCRRSPSPMSSCSDSYSSRSRSRSCSPVKKRYRRRDSDRDSNSSSRSSSRSSPSVSRSPPRRRRYSYSSSRSGSWSRSRSRSQSPQRQTQWRRNRQLYSPSYRPSFDHGVNVDEVKRRKEKAIEERRVVYVGRIRGTMTQKELRDRFSLFGEVEECTLHFRDHGDNYGFVTYYDTKDAFIAIENGSKLRKPDELPFDLCFGGRRQFCQASYSDLDSSREYDPLPPNGKFHALDFDTLLKQAQQNLKR